MKACARCGIAVQGRGRSYCADCSVQRKKETNAAFWQRRAQAKPVLTCSKCQATYGPRSGTATLRHLCPPCAIEQRRENVKQYDRQRGGGSSRGLPETQRAYTRQYKREHPEQNRKQRRAYYQRHPERVKLRAREDVNNRRARLAGTPGTITIEGFWAKCEALGWLCQYCRKPLTKRTATIDHGIPLGATDSTNTLPNIVPCCRPCNTRKGKRLHESGDGSA